MWCSLSISVSPVVFPELSLTPHNLSTVLDSMDDHLCLLFGAHVNIPNSELERIMRQYSSDSERKQAVISSLISSHPALSWRLVANALYLLGYVTRVAPNPTAESPAVGHSEVAVIPVSKLISSSKVVEVIEQLKQNLTSSIRPVIDKDSVDPAVATTMVTPQTTPVDGGASCHRALDHLQKLFPTGNIHVHCIQYPFVNMYMCT